MTYPKLEIYLNEASELCVVKIESADSAPRPIVETALNELLLDGIDEASLQLGHGILTSIKRWHLQEFESAAPPLAPVVPVDDAGELAHRLIAKSVENRTAVHIPSIEALLFVEINIDPSAREFFDESWPAIRQRLSSFAV
jgi:hypothetical protein